MEDLLPVWEVHFTSSERKPYTKTFLTKIEALQEIGHSFRLTRYLLKVRKHHYRRKIFPDGGRYIYVPYSNPFIYHKWRLEEKYVPITYDEKGEQHENRQNP